MYGDKDAAAKEDFNPQGPRGPRRLSNKWSEESRTNFNPQGPRGPRRSPYFINHSSKSFQSTRPSRASTTEALVNATPRGYFNPQGPRGPRRIYQGCIHTKQDFNPQGPRGPRQWLQCRTIVIDPISIHKALAGLDENNPYDPIDTEISIHKALAGLDGI